MIKKASPKSTSLPRNPSNVDHLADFVLFTQRSCILNLASELNKGNISYPQFFLLTYLSSEESLTMSDISKKMCHSTAASTGLVDRLEKMDYLKRFHAAEDRRKIMVAITEKGKELVQQLKKELSKNLADIMADIDAVDSDAILKASPAMQRISIR